MAYSFEFMLIHILCMAIDMSLVYFILSLSLSKYYLLNSHTLSCDLCHVLGSQYI